MKTVLLTGFEPFGGDTANPSADVARALNGFLTGTGEVVGAVLPCVFGESTRVLRRLIKAHSPDLVICLGLAATRTVITPERMAINLDDARIPDNAGQQPLDKPVVRGGPVAYWSTLPVKAIVDALRERGLPAELSQSAGTFVCNHVFYGLMHQLSASGSRVRGGFIHLPWAAPEKTKNSGLTLTDLASGVRIAIETSLPVRPDLRGSSGTLTADAS